MAGIAYYLVFLSTYCPRDSPPQLPEILRRNFSFKKKKPMLRSHQLLRRVVYFATNTYATAPLYSRFCSSRPLVSMMAFWVQLGP